MKGKFFITIILFIFTLGVLCKKVSKTTKEGNVSKSTEVPT